MRVALVILSVLLAASVRAQPNVVLVTVDDLSTAVGFLSEEPGNPLQTLYPDPEARARVRAVLTPHLDRLADEGVPFASAHATSSVCAPSRASLMTGVRPHVSGFYGGSHIRDNDALAAVATLPEYLRAHGTYTAGVGKVFHGPMVRLGEDGTISRDDPDALRSWDLWINRRVSPGIATDWSPWSPGEDFFRFGTNDEPLEAQADARNAAVVAEALRTGRGTLFDEALGVPRTLALPSDRPFFLAVGLYRPHVPWAVPESLLGLFDPDDLALTDSLREVFFRDTDDLAPEARRRLYREGETLVDGHAKLLYEHGESLDPAHGAVRAWKAAVLHYLAGIAQADRVIGMLLDALEAGPYAEDTVVIVVGDHGYHLGEKAWFGKTTLWELSTATPLIVRPTEAVVAPGQLRRQPVSLADLFPTVLGLTGTPALPGLGGVDLAPLLADPTAPPISTALTQMGLDDHTLRTDRFRYVRFNEDPTEAELYDVQADPEERRNVIADPAYASAKAEMEARLADALAQRDLPPPSPVRSEPSPASVALSLGPAQPNPSRGSVALRLMLPDRARVRWEAVDALGRVVWREALGERPPGETWLRWNGAASGVYTVRVFADGEVVGVRRVAVAR